LEERVVAKVSSRLNAKTSNREATAIIAQAGRQLLPAAVDLAAPPEESAEHPGTAPNLGLRQSWLLVDFYYELRAMVQMFFDRRYRVAWLARIVPIVALICFLFSWFFIDSIRLIGPFLDKVFDVFLVCLLYKVLSREAQRYRRAVDELPPLRRV
jgi:hypothetical protein